MCDICKVLRWYGWVLQWRSRVNNLDVSGNKRTYIYLVTGANLSLNIKRNKYNFIQYTTFQTAISYLWESRSLESDLFDESVELVS